MATNESIIDDSAQAQHARAPLLVITELFLPTKGGTAVWFDEVYRRLGGKEIHVVTASVAGAREHDRDHPNSIHRVRLLRHWWLRPESLAMYAKLFIRSMWLCWRHGVQIIHAGRVLPEGLVGLAVARIARVPLIVYAHGEEITGWRNPSKFRAKVHVYRHADRIIANSEFTRSELLKLGVDANRICLIRPGVDTFRFRPGLPGEDLRHRLGIPAERKVVLSVGRLSRRKGFDQTIRAVARLRAEGLDVAYVLIGIGPDREYLESIALECGVRKHVHFLGEVRPGELPNWYCAADVFTMPNRKIGGDTEGFGMVFVEAAACGKAVVAGKEGGTADAVLDGVTGFRIDGESLDELVGALRRLLVDGELCARMGNDGFERVQAELSWERVAQTTRSLCISKNALN